MITATRRFHFSASHRLHIDGLSDQDNEQLYGKCNNPYGHGHDYVLEVTCSGPLNERTGLLLPVGTLDHLVNQEVLAAVAFRYLNKELDEFAHLVPTTENIAAVIVQRLQSKWHSTMGDAVHLVRVHVQETDRNGFEVLLDTPAQANNPERERVSDA